MNLDEFDKWEYFEESTQVNNINKLNGQQFIDFIAYQALLQEAQKNPFEYLFSDIINPQLFSHDFKSQFISHSGPYNIYEVLNDDAKSCIFIGTSMRSIPVTVFPNWLDNALKVADHLVLYYIQEFMNLSALEGETNRYLQLETFDCNDIRTAGQKLKYIYENRNLHAHRTQNVGNKKILVKLNRNKIRHACIKEISTGYLRLQKAFSKAYPSYGIA